MQISKVRIKSMQVARSIVNKLSCLEEWLSTTRRRLGLFLLLFVPFIHVICCTNRKNISIAFAIDCLLGRLFSRFPHIDCCGSPISKAFIILKKSSFILLIP